MHVLAMGGIHNIEPNLLLGGAFSLSEWFSSIVCVFPIIVCICLKQASISFNCRIKKYILATLLPNAKLFST